MCSCREDESLKEKLEKSILEPQRVCAGVGDGGKNGYYCPSGLYSHVHSQELKSTAQTGLDLGSY